MVYALMFRRRVHWRIRLMAAVNMFCAVYFLSMTLTVSCLSFFKIVPEAYQNDAWTIFCHRISISYIFANVFGNLASCIVTKTSVKSVSQGNTMALGKTRGLRTKDKLEAMPTKRKEPTSKEVTSCEEKETWWCSFCKATMPDRAHHCVLCETCILRRDHHCFFMGTCVGQNNHRDFILFTFYMAIGTLYGMLLIVKYLFLKYGVKFYGPQTFFTFFLQVFSLLWRNKNPSVEFIALFVLMYVSLFGGLFACGLLFWQMSIVLNGQTTYEAKRGITKYSHGSKKKNFQEVFGRYFIPNLLLPFYSLARQFDK